MAKASADTMPLVDRRSRGSRHSRVSSRDTEPEQLTRVERLWAKGPYGKVGTTKLPGSYMESSPILLMLKAVALSFVMVVPYYVVLDQVSSLNETDFAPCDDGCKYFRIFAAGGLPGTGTSYVSVKNGMNRPIVYDSVRFAPYVTEKGHSEQLSNLSACPATQEQFQFEINESKKTTWAHKAASFVTRIPMSVSFLPLVGLSYLSPPSDRGVENIPNGQCSATKSGHVNMTKVCSEPLVMRNISNTLKVGGSIVSLKLALLGWGSLTAVHDVMLLSKKFEDRPVLPLTVGAWSIVCQGLAALALFFWASGVCGVFIAEHLEGYGDDCSCFYSYPALPALAALSTPFALVFSFVGKVEMWALSALYGDYLYTVTYATPHHLASKSLLWSWGVLVTPYVQGVVPKEKDERELIEQTSWFDVMMKADHKGYDVLYNYCFRLWLLRYVLLAMISVAAAPFLVKMNESVLNLATNASGIGSAAISGFLLLPPILTVVFACWTTLWAKEKFLDGNLLRDLADDEEKEGSLKLEEHHSRFVFYFICCCQFVTVCACVEGLSPTWETFWNPSAHTTADLGTYEIWCSCGWALFVQILFSVTSNIFIMEDELNLLRTADNEHMYQDSDSARHIEIGMGNEKLEA